MKVHCAHDKMVSVAELQSHPKPLDVYIKLFGCYSAPMTIRSKETVRLFLGNDEIRVDYRDLHWFGQYKFFVVQGRGQAKYLTANTPSRTRTIQLHQLIMDPPKGLEVDHINGDGLDNRRENLRIVTHQTNQNNLPKQKASSSKFHGVYWDVTRGKWLCQIQFDGTRRSIGRFDSPETAAVAYNNAVIGMGLEGKKRLNQV